MHLLSERAAGDKPPLYELAGAGGLGCAKARCNFFNFSDGRFHGAPPPLARLPPLSPPEEKGWRS